MSELLYTYDYTMFIIAKSYGYDIMEKKNMMIILLAVIVVIAVVAGVMLLNPTTAK